MNLTPEENKAFDLTADLWNALLALPVQHEADLKEAAALIHGLQNQIVSRPMFRILNEQAANKTEK